MRRVQTINPHQCDFGRRTTARFVVTATSSFAGRVCLLDWGAQVVAHAVTIIKRKHQHIRGATQHAKPECAIDQATPHLRVWHVVCLVVIVCFGCWCLRSDPRVITRARGDRFGRCVYLLSSCCLLADSWCGVGLMVRCWLVAGTAAAIWLRWALWLRGRPWSENKLLFTRFAPSLFRSLPLKRTHILRCRCAWWSYVTRLLFYIIVSYRFVLMTFKLNDIQNPNKWFICGYTSSLY